MIEEQRDIIHKTAMLISAKTSVPVSVAAKVYGKDPQWIRAGLITGYLPIGMATKQGRQITDLKEQGKGGRINYYISPKLLYEQTGYIWREIRNDSRRIDKEIREYATECPYICRGRISR